MIIWVADTTDDKLYAYDLPVLNDATLSDLTVSPANLIWFDSETATYHFRVADAVTRVTITPTANDAGATIDIGGTAVTSGAGHLVALNPDGVTPTDVTVTVTAEDGQTTKAYTVRVTWAASSDATLRGLTLSGIPFGFNPATESYTLGGSDGVSLSSTTVTPTVNIPAASYSINGVPLNTAGKVNLAFGANTITIVVTAADDSTKTYTITVSRKAPPPGTLLRELRLVYQPFVEDTFIGKCPVTVSSSGRCYATPGIHHTEFDVDTGTVDVVTVAANAAAEDATVTFNYPDFDPDKGGHQVKLAGLGTSPTIEVTVANPGGAITAYKINVSPPALRRHPAGRAERDQDRGPVVHHVRVGVPQPAGQQPGAGVQYRVERGHRAAAPGPLPRDPAVQRPRRRRRKRRGDRRGEAAARRRLGGNPRGGLRHQSRS